MNVSMCPQLDEMFLVLSKTSSSGVYIYYRGNLPKRVVKSANLQKRVVDVADYPSRTVVGPISPNE